MEWDELFGELTGELEEEARAGRESEQADRARAERAVLDLGRRLRGHIGAPLIFEVLPERRCAGRVRDVGAGWIAVDFEEPGHGGAKRQPATVVINLSTVTAVRGLTRAAGESKVPLHRALGMSVVLRGLAVRRVPVRLDLVNGRCLTGTLDRIGPDHLDLAEHPLDEPRRRSAVRAVIAVPLGAVATVEADFF